MHNSAAMPSGRPGDYPMTGLALLRVPAWEPERFAAQLNLDWEIDPGEVPENFREPWVFRAAGSIVVIGFEPHPVPDNAADELARNCVDWPDAAEIARTHAACLAVAVIAETATLVENARTAMKVLGSLARQANVSAVNSAQRLFEPEAFRTDVMTMQGSSSAFPIFNMVYFGLWRSGEDEPLSGCTVGLANFMCPELEILRSPDAPAVIRAQMIAAAMTQITRGRPLEEGEELALSGTRFRAELRDSTAIPGTKTTHLVALGPVPAGEPAKRKRF